MSSICVNFCRSYAPFGTENDENTQFSALSSYMLWHIVLKFCIWLCFTVLQIKFEYRQFASIFVGVMPLLEFRILEIHSFPHFSLTYRAEILNMTLFYCTTDQVRVLSIFVGVMPLLELRILKFTVFRTFPLHALTYWAEILHMTLFYCTAEQVWVSSMHWQI